MAGTAQAATLALPPVTVTVGGAVVSQIHNSPGWLPSHAYAPASGPFTRVNSGPGWNPATGAWIPGQSLNAYQITSGACTSGTVMPTGTGASIQDGSCTWKYLSATDYISLTGWSADSKPWAGGGVYQYHAIVTSDSPLRAYMQINDACTSTIPPAGKGSSYTTDGEGFSLGAGSDGCQWVYFADVLYSSRKSFIPPQSYTGKTGNVTVNVLSDHIAQLWNDRQYVAGQNGEKSPIEIRNHNSLYGEGQTMVCAGPTCGHVVVTVAPGEGFADTLKPSDPFTGYDPSKGVSILITDGIRWPTTPDGLWVENSTDIIGLQIKSMRGGAIGSATSSYDNAVTIKNCILEGGNFDNPYSTPAVVSIDTWSSVSNSLLISHSPHGIVSKYPSFIIHDTIVNVEGTGLAGIETGNKWVFDNTTVSNTAVFGFAHAGAVLDKTTGFNAASANNVTDAPVGDSGITEWNGSTPADGTVVVIPGTIYGSSSAAAFMAPSDYRPKPGGTLAGKGAAFGTFVTFCSTGACGGNVNLNFDTPDILGTPRPGRSGYDIGSQQTP
jgi:hypothetical protein